MKVSAAEQKRRSAARMQLYTAASTLELYGRDPKLAKQLQTIADDIYENGKKEN